MNPPVYVASKGRADAPVFALLHEADVRPLVFVEPQDAERYAAHQMYVLPENDRGLAFARQAALDHARACGIEWYWMLDDDITAFWRTNTYAHRNDKVTADYVLQRAERWADSRDVPLGIVALEYSQYSWNAKRGAVTWTSYCDCAVLINTEPAVNYRISLPLKVDRDFTLQVLTAGYAVARLRDIAFTVPRNGSNAGGLHDRYADGIEAKASQRMAELWPDVCTPVTKPDGRPDVKIAWRKVRAAVHA